jgi:hypothetical protein
MPLQQRKPKKGEQQPMKRIRLVGLAILAILALSAITATTASAENVEVLPVPTKTAPVKFESKGPAGVLAGEQAGSAIECKELTNSGEITSANLGVATLKFTGCKSELSGAKCESLPKVAAGTIELKVDFHLVDLLLGEGEPLPKLMLGLVIILLELLHVECGAALLILIGEALIGEFNAKTPESGVKTTGGTVLFEQTKGVQKVKECDLDKAFCEPGGKKATFGLYIELGKGREKGGIKQEDTITFIPAKTEAAFDF